MSTRFAPDTAQRWLWERALDDGPLEIERTAVRVLAVTRLLLDDFELHVALRDGMAAMTACLVERSIDVGVMRDRIEPLEWETPRSPGEAAVAIAVGLGSWIAFRSRHADWTWTCANILIAASDALTKAIEALEIDHAGAVAIMSGALDWVPPRPPRWRRGRPIADLVRALHPGDHEDEEIREQWLAEVAPFGIDIDRYIASIESDLTLTQLLLATGTPRQAILATLLERLTPHVVPYAALDAQLARIRSALAGTLPREEVILEAKLTDWVPHMYTQGPARAVTRMALLEDELLYLDELHGWLAHQVATPGSDDYRDHVRREARTTCDLLRARHRIGDASAIDDEEVELGHLQRAARSARRAAWNPQTGVWGFAMRCGMDLESVSKNMDLAACWEHADDPHALVSLWSALPVDPIEQRRVTCAVVTRLVDKLPAYLREDFDRARRVVTGTEALAIALGSQIEAVLHCDEALPDDLHEATRALFSACALAVLAGTEWEQPGLFVERLHDLATETEIIAAIRKEISPDQIRAAWARFGQ